MIEGQRKGDRWDRDYSTQYETLCGWSVEIRRGRFRRERKGWRRPGEEYKIKRIQLSKPVGLESWIFILR